MTVARTRISMLVVGALLLCAEKSFAGAASMTDQGFGNFAGIV